MMKRIFHWGPVLAFGIIKLVSWTTVHCTVLWLPCMESIFGFINATTFFGLAFLTIYNFLCSIIVGPGFVPFQWRPHNREDERCLQFCVSCNGFKAPRSHHCRKCGRCVMKMDHHCPWINNCVGHFNHKYFVLFLFFAICGSIHSCTLLTLTVYKFLTANMYYVKGFPPPVKLSLTWFILCIFSIGITLGIFFALSFLLYIQIKSVIRNCTGIEDWILEKAEERRNIDPTISPFVFPYDLGWQENLYQVFKDTGDGITWKLKSGCCEYDLTTEQLQQKELKKLRKKPFKVIKKYSGAVFPIVNGICACIRPPCSTEARMPLNIGEVILVTRYQKFWLFGEKNNNTISDRRKGWFPKSCVIPVTEYQCPDYSSKIAKKEL